MLFAAENKLDLALLLRLLHRSREPLPGALKHDPISIAGGSTVIKDHLL